MTCVHKAGPRGELIGPWGGVDYAFGVVGVGERGDAKWRVRLERGDVLDGFVLRRDGLGGGGGGALFVKRHQDVDGEFGSWAV